MNTVKVVLRDGTRREGPLWVWRPRDGWFSLVEEYAPLGVPAIRLIDCVSAVEVNKRVGPCGEVTDVDLLAKAREDGWTGDSP